MITPVFSGSREGSFHTPISRFSNVTFRWAPGHFPVQLSAVSPSGSAGNHGCFPRPVSSTATTGGCSGTVTPPLGSGADQTTGVRPPTPGVPYSATAPPAPPQTPPAPPQTPPAPPHTPPAPPHTPPAPPQTP